MTRLIVLIFLFVASSPNVDADIRLDARKRIEKLVVEPLRGRVVFSSVFPFSRARVARLAPELRLWTSRPATDAEGRTFVPFRLRELVPEDSPSSPTTFAGCYYPEDDAAYLRLGDRNRYVAIDDHPVLTLQLLQAVAEVSRCRAEH